MCSGPGAYYSRDLARDSPQKPVAEAELMECQAVWPAVAGSRVLLLLLQTKVTIAGKMKFTIGKILSGHFWYTNLWVPELPPPFCYFPPHEHFASSLLSA